MSEIKKNIETCRGEDVLAEVSALPQDPHFGSLVNEAFDPMQQQALHQAGYDGYSEVIAQHQPYTFASASIQMKSNLLLLLRALWQFPFGTGTLRSLSDDASLRSLADMWQHYITRLSGNPEHGIPSRLSSLTDLPSAPLLLADRKISGVPEAADGMSLLHLLNDTSEVTELTDDNKYTMLSSKIYPALQLFPQLEKVQFGCKVWNTNYVYLLQSSAIEEIEFPNLEEITKTSDIRDESKAEIYCANLSSITFPKLKKINYAGWNTPLISSTVLTKIEMPELEEFVGSTYYVKIIGGANNYDNSVEELIMPKLKSVSVTSNSGSNFIGCCNQLKKVEMGTLVAFPTGVFGACPLLTDLRIGEGTAISLNLSNWNPTLTDSDVLALFLSNFRTYIAERLADNGSGLTLTLSQAVFSSIWDANGNPQVLHDGLDELRASIHNIVKTTKHWDVNKAS
jgi:hypothetical protein